MENNMNMLLFGIKVVELSTVVAAPTTARMLCAYGAEVIKIETSYGDEERRSGSFQKVPYEDDRNPVFAIKNSNKRFVSINIKSEVGREAIMKLLSDADVFLTNVRGASLKRNGLDYETLKEKFPRLVYAHFTGYGPKGPDANDPGFDSTAFWLRSGGQNEWQVKGAYPFKPTYAFGDMATSSTFLAGILMALYGREKTGRGTKVETSLLASGIWCNATGIVATQFERKHLNPDPENRTDPLSEYYMCKDGRWIMVCENEYKRDKDKYFKVLGLDYLIGDPRVETIEALNESGMVKEVFEQFEKKFAEKTSKELRKMFIAENISCEIMCEMNEVARDPQAIENGYVEELEFGGGMKVMMPSPPIFFSEYGRKPYDITGPLGRDTDEVFSELGYSREEIAEMKAEGVIK